MAFRDKLIERTTPLLRPNEQVQQIFIADAAKSPALSTMLGLLGWILFAKPRVVAVTDQAVVVFKTNFNGTSPKEELARLPRGSVVGQTKGIWAKLQVGDDTMFVHRKFHKEVDAAVATASGS
jgi:hypothetical protein